jgi:hypothetical protein
LLPDRDIREKTDRGPLAPAMAVDREALRHDFVYAIRGRDVVRHRDLGMVYASRGIEQCIGLGIGHADEIVGAVAVGSKVRRHRRQHPRNDGADRRKARAQEQHEQRGRGKRGSTCAPAEEPEQATQALVGTEQDQRQDTGD